MECLDTKASVFAMFIFQDSLAKTSVYFLMLQQIMEYLDTKTKEEECCSPFCSKPGQAKSTPFDRASCRFSFELFDAHDKLYHWSQAR